MTADVLVVGGGPAGRSLAAECGRRGLRTVLVDRSPDTPWRATYGCWAEELPPTLPASVVAARARGRAIARTPWELGREYAVLDVPELRRHLDDELAAGGVEIVAGRAGGLSGPDTVTMQDGATLRASVVVDAGGHRQPLGLRSPSGARPVAAEQTAYGIVVDEVTAAPIVAPGEALFMDWRPHHGEPGWPTFLYAVPLGRGRVLLEETSLARRPGLPLATLRRRLHARLVRRGVVAPAGAVAERVHFRVDSPRHATPGVLGFGAATPLVHPASGFSIAAALNLAPAVAAAIATDPGAARSVLWSRSALAVHALRRIGLEALLRMPATAVPDFFEVFFALPERHRWAYLCGRDDLAGMTATMAALFAHADWTLRYRLVGPALRPPAPPLREPA